MTIMIEQLGDIQPFLLLFMLVVMYGLENLFPYLSRPAKKGLHYRQNWAITIISFILNIFMGMLVVSTLEYTTQHHWGLLNNVNLPEVVKIIAGMLLFDFGSFLTHNLQHKMAFLWRFHRVHHSDPHLDSSTSLRFHPGDTLVAQCIYQCIGVALFGVSMTSFILYGTIAIPLLIMQHSNVKLPDWVERYGRLVFATPGWHKIHHSSFQPETDSHYGDVFTFWDRIFGTWGHVQPHEIKYGLDEFKQDEQHSVWYLMISPVKNFKKDSPEKKARKISNIYTKGSFRPDGED